MDGGSPGKMAEKRRRAILHDEDTLSNDSLRKILALDQCAASSSEMENKNGSSSKDVGCWQDVLGDVSLSGFSDIVTGTSFNINDVMDFVHKQASGSCLSPNGGDESTSQRSFQFILMSPTSAAVALDVEPLTYLNSHQRYEIKCRRLGNVDTVPKYYRSRLRLSFHNREHQFREEELMNKWRLDHPNKKVVDIDVPNCTGTHNMRTNEKLNMIEFLWDPKSNTTSLYIKINIISTEFTERKHGGEKGIPFRLSLETFEDEGADAKQLHSAHAQIRVFKTKGADRKNSADRERAKRYNTKPFQPAYDYTIFTETFTGDNVVTSPPAQDLVPVQETKCLPNNKLSDEKAGSLDFKCSSVETCNWLSRNRFDHLLATFQSFNGEDMYRLTRNDLTSLCPCLADATRLHNSLHNRKCLPKCLIYVRIQDKGEAFRAVFLHELTVNELRKNLSLFFECENNCEVDLGNTELIWMGPDNIKVIVSDQIVQYCIMKSCKYNLSVQYPPGSHNPSTVTLKLLP